MEEFEKDWIRINRDGLAAGDGEVIKVMLPALFAVMDFCAALRGEDSD